MKKIQSTNLFATVAFSLLLQSCANRLPELPTETVLVPLEKAEESINTIYAANDTTSVTSLTTGATVATVANRQIQEFVAQNLVAALPFISGISPTQISITAPRVNSKFDWQVQAAMLRSGYSLGQRFGQAPSKQLVTSFQQTQRSDGSLEVTAIISINSILVRRSYIVQGKSIQPGTSYLISGVDPQLVQTTEQVSVL